MSPTGMVRTLAAPSPLRSVDPWCASAYLGLRYVPDATPWVPGVAAEHREHPRSRTLVDTAADIEAALRDLFPRAGRTALLLSAGIDSAILAALAPTGTPCFTIAFDAPGSIDESPAAAEYAHRFGHPHEVVRVGWADYLAHVDGLMLAKGAPLHAVEVPLHLAARRAAARGVDTLVVGNGADSTFGGMDKLLTPEWTFDAFVERYLFCDPARLLVESRDLTPVFWPWRRGEGIDVEGFLREVHGAGIVQAFDNAITTAGITISAPYEALGLRGPLDLERVRRGEPKYLLQELFRRLHGTAHVPTKIPFARPTDVWFRDWEGPGGDARFRDDAARWLAGMGGEPRWLAWSLERFFGLLDAGASR